MKKQPIKIIKPKKDPIFPNIVTLKITAIKDKDTYRADKKQANVLRREAQQSLAARKNAGN